MLEIHGKENFDRKREYNNSPQIKTIDKKFADIPEGSKMFIATPQIIDAYVMHIPFGHTSELVTIRNDLTIQHPKIINMR